MIATPVDPGYGKASAPVGSVEWAKHWRLTFQSAVKDLPHATERNRKYYEVGEQYRAYQKLTDADGQPFRNFDSFCDYRQPWGLGMDPVKFRNYLAAEVGKKAADLITVNPGNDVGGRPAKGEETAASDAAVSPGQCQRKQEALRAILRAPELIQSLYHEGLITQADAAKMGPKAPSVDASEATKQKAIARAARVEEARQAIDAIARPASDLFTPEEERKKQRLDYRKEVKKTIRRILGKPDPTPLEKIQAAWVKLSEPDRLAFRSWLEAQS